MAVAPKKKKTAPKLTVVAKPVSGTPLRTVAFGTMPAAKPSTPAKKTAAKKKTTATVAAADTGSGNGLLLVAALVGGYLLLRS